MREAKQIETQLKEHFAIQLDTDRALHKQEIGKLQSRVSELVDEIQILKNDVQDFKKNVAKDISRLVSKPRR